MPPDALGSPSAMQLDRTKEIVCLVLISILMTLIHRLWCSSCGERISMWPINVASLRILTKKLLLRQGILFLNHLLHMRVATCIPLLTSPLPSAHVSYNPPKYSALNTNKNAWLSFCLWNQWEWKLLKCKPTIKLLRSPIRVSFYYSMFRRFMSYEYYKDEAYICDRRGANKNCWDDHIFNGMECQLEIYLSLVFLQWRRRSLSNLEPLFFLTFSLIAIIGIWL